MRQQTKAADNMSMDERSDVLLRAGRTSAINELAAIQTRIHANRRLLSYGDERVIKHSARVPK